MNSLTLNGTWQMKTTGSETGIPSQVPGSVYDTLLTQGLMEDPYYGENEDKSYAISFHDYQFERNFSVTEEMLSHRALLLRFDGLDTIADVFLNGTHLGYADNMHRIWEYSVKSYLRVGENHLRVAFRSPVSYVTEKQQAYELYGGSCTTAGYPHIRKAHYMFGWDWGPKLPDMGIWRPVTLLMLDEGRLDHVHVTQTHKNGLVHLSFQVGAEVLTDTPLNVALTLTAPGGSRTQLEIPLSAGQGTGSVTVENPEIWWPHGYGSQPLYQVHAELLCGDSPIDSRDLRIGLRTITISRDKDAWGEEFCFQVNGVKIFSMGANYIPEDQIIPRCSKERTKNLLQQCIQANYNTLRVWGGGYYPEDWLFDLCDEMGLIVWQDFMFACSAYRLTDEFRENVRRECIENVKRIRHHACLGIWCGNNECETMWENWGIPQSRELRQDYLTLFEEVIPEVCREYDPDTFYWPSSPSCGGGFDAPGDCTRGDMHYWDVWHGMLPLTEFRKIYFRFCSEYGFEALPNIKTIRSFASPEEQNLFSATMEAHQKCTEGNKKLLYYMSQMVRYPYSFPHIIYASQLLQADAIRSNVEHMRRNRGRCMGSTYWQVNDSNPVISWSSIDSCGRWKALHYYARRFHAPVLLSVNEEDPSALLFNISNERFRKVAGVLHWELRDRTASILKQGSIPAEVDPLSARDVLVLDLSAELASMEDKREKYLSYRLIEQGQTLSCGSSLFVRPKHFRFLNPHLAAELEENDTRLILTLWGSAYAKSVCLDLQNADCVFSDNWFDVHGMQSVTVTIDKETLSVPLSLDEFREQLTICSNYDIGR